MSFVEGTLGEGSTIGCDAGHINARHGAMPCDAGHTSAVSSHTGPLRNPLIGAKGSFPVGATPDLCNSLCVDDADLRPGRMFMTFRYNTGRVLVSLCLSLVTSPAWAGGHEGAPVTQEIITGSLTCKFLADGTGCGTSDWTMTIQTDGSRTLRVLNERDVSGAQNNILLRVDSAFRPLEGFAQVYNAGSMLGSGFFVVDGNSLKATVTGTEGLQQYQENIPDQFSLLLHPPPADGWHFGHHYDHDKGGVQMGAICGLGGVPGGVMCKTRDRPMEFLRSETLEVGAGTFETEKYKFGDNTEIWTTGPHKIVVRHDFTTLGTSYTLTSLKRRRP